MGREYQKSPWSWSPYAYTMLHFICSCTRKCDFNITRCQMVHTCRRSAEIIAVILKSENGGGGETDIRGVLLCPQTLFFQAFLITLRGREQCGAQTLRTPSESSTVSSFSTQKKERNQRAEERCGKARRGRAAVKDMDARGDKVPHQRGLCSLLLLQYLSSKLDAKHVSTRPELEAAFGSLLSL